jgi:hypothetical protein
MLICARLDSASHEVGAHQELRQSTGLILSCFGCEAEATDSVVFRQSGSLSESDVHLSGSDLAPQHPKARFIAQKRTTRNFVAKDGEDSEQNLIALCVAGRSLVRGGAKTFC